MLVRLGFVAMSVHLKDASPSKTITRTRFETLDDPQRALNHIRSLVEINAQNTLRLLRYCGSRDIHLYRLTSKLIPLATILLQTHELQELVSSRALQLFSECGKTAKEQHLRISAHPDHFTVLGSTNPSVVESAILNLRYHHEILELMGLSDSCYQLVLHVGSAVGGKEAAMKRFAETFEKLPSLLQRRLMLENDDKTYTTGETLSLCQKLKIPMVLDVHHMICNGTPDDTLLLPEILQTWNGQAFPPKFHFSTPRSPKTPRAHADYIDPCCFREFLMQLKNAGAQQADIMLEAKQKDEALFTLMRALSDCKDIQPVDGGSFII